jgi:hypothetical protein
LPSAPVRRWLPAERHPADTQHRHPGAASPEAGAFFYP